MIRSLGQRNFSLENNESLLGRLFRLFPEVVDLLDGLKSSN